MEVKVPNVNTARQRDLPRYDTVRADKLLESLGAPPQWSTPPRDRTSRLTRLGQKIEELTNKSSLLALVYWAFTS